MNMPKFKDKIIDYVSRQKESIMEPVVGRTRLVRFTKVILLVFALIISAILVIMPISGGINKNFRLTFSSVEKSENGQLPQMINPNLQGIDGRGQAYNISAKTAVKDKNETMILNQITGDINLVSGGWVSLSADEAFFNHSRHSLDLQGNISVFNQDGYEFYTDQAYANIKKNSIYGNEKIVGQGPIGTIEADSFYVEDNGARIFLRGNVKITLFPKKEK